MNNCSSTGKTLSRDAKRPNRTARHGDGMAKDIPGQIGREFDFSVVFMKTQRTYLILPHREGCIAVQGLFDQPQSEQQENGKYEGIE